VARRIFQLAAGLVLVLVVLLPLAECFDRWDNHVVPANDTELNLTMWIAGAGMVLALSKLLRCVPTPAASTGRALRACFDLGDLEVFARKLPASTAGPPSTPLRI
jgi:predicted component of type VI protein secretion system